MRLSKQAVKGIHLVDIHEAEKKSSQIERMLYESRYRSHHPLSLDTSAKGSNSNEPEKEVNSDMEEIDGEADNEEEIEEKEDDEENEEKEEKEDEEMKDKKEEAARVEKAAEEGQAPEAPNTEGKKKRKRGAEEAEDAAQRSIIAQEDVEEVALRDYDAEDTLAAILEGRKDEAMAVQASASSSTSATATTTTTTTPPPIQVTIQNGLDDATWNSINSNYNLSNNNFRQILANWVRGRTTATTRRSDEVEVEDSDREIEQVQDQDGDEEDDDEEAGANARRLDYNLDGSEPELRVGALIKIESETGSKVFPH